MALTSLKFSFGTSFLMCFIISRSHFYAHFKTVIFLCSHHVTLCAYTQGHTLERILCEFPRQRIEIQIKTIAQNIYMIPHPQAYI